MRKRYWGAALLVACSAAIAAIAGLSSSAGAAPERSGATKVTLQLKWVTQAQFAGYYAAKAKGYYSQQGLDVNLKPGGPDIIPEQIVAGGQAEFGINWLSNQLAARDKGSNLVNIAQVFTLSGLTLLTWKDTGLNTVSKLRGKKVANWLGGNEWEVFAALVKNGMDPLKNKGVTIVQQPFDMNLFLKRQVHAASAMTYNELAQVLEAKDPKTGKLTKLKDLNVIYMSKIGTGMLEDGVFVRGDWIKSKTNQATARKFLTASFKGWIYCRSHPKECVDIVLKNGPALPKGHQTWQMNEINALIWPAPKSIGIMDPAAFKRTAKIALQFKAIKKPASSAAYRTDLARAAVAALKKQGYDVNGRGWKKATVKLTAGGK